MDCGSSNHLYSLHPGDIIEYYDLATIHSSPTVVRATVTSIVDSCFQNEKCTVITSAELFHPLDMQHNDRFRIVSSNYKDAPLPGKWTSLNKVNLGVKGKIPVPKCRYTQTKNIAATPGGKVVEAFAALANASGKYKNRPLTDVDAPRARKKQKKTANPCFYKKKKRK